MELADPKRIVKWTVDPLVFSKLQTKNCGKSRDEYPQNLEKKRCDILQVLSGAVENFHGVGVGFNEGYYATKM